VSPHFPLPSPSRAHSDQECNPQLAAWLDAMRAAVHVYGLRLPDVVLNLNVIDGGVLCRRGRDWAERERDCAAPAVSISGEEASTNVVAPMMLLPDANVTWRHAPWPAKARKAFFRGVPSCGEMVFEHACARIWVARLAQLRPDLVDAGGRGRSARVAQVVGLVEARPRLRASTGAESSRPVGCEGFVRRGNRNRCHPPTLLQAW
jgi:hypothetical protein